MRNVFILCLLAVVGAQSHFQRDEPSPPLLVSRSPLSRHAVENRELAVEYVIVNIGSLPIKNVELDDRLAFPTDSFDVVNGSHYVRFPTIFPRSNVTHILVVRPRVSKLFPIGSAAVFYDDPVTGEQHLTRSMIFSLFVNSEIEYQRQMGPRVHYFACFAFIVVPLTLLPMHLYMKSKKRYQNIPKKHK